MSLLSKLLKQRSERLATSAPATFATQVLQEEPTSLAPERGAYLTAITSCTTCAKVTRRGGCGDPVHAGLSELEGVIRYHPTGGKACIAWLKPESTEEVNSLGKN
jgi:hypothetical protein